jgi:hypothetical protein
VGGRRLEAVDVVLEVLLHSHKLCTQNVPQTPTVEIELDVYANGANHVDCAEAATVSFALPRRLCDHVPKSY